MTPSGRSTRSFTYDAVTTLYVHDLDDHIIAETDTSGQTLREYIWLGDIPLAVVDKVATGAPVIYYVHADHLGRPARMTAQNQAWVWDVIYSPFGETSYIWTNPGTLDIRFPGQWFQLESGLHYNWHRHYDATLGRYLQPDPLGLTALLGNGPSIYGYAGQNPLAKVDPRGELFFLPAIPIIGPALGGAAGVLGEAAIGLTIGTGTGIGLAWLNEKWQGRTRGKTDPVQGQVPVNPGRDCNGKCNPCPQNEYWEAEGDAHGSTGGRHRHGIEWNQDPATCMCYPKRISAPN